MKKLKLVFIISIFLPLMLSCKTGTLLSASEDVPEKNAAQSQYGDQEELKEFLFNFTKAVESGNWDHVLTFFDRDNYLEQMSIGVGANQYIIEGMQLPVGAFAVEGGVADLNMLKSLVVINIDYAVDVCYAEARGDAVLKDGRRIPFLLFIIRYPEGNFAIAPPVG